MVRLATAGPVCLSLTPYDPLVCAPRKHETLTNHLGSNPICRLGMLLCVSEYLSIQP